MRVWAFLLLPGLLLGAGFLTVDAPVAAQTGRVEPRELHIGAGGCAAQACHGGTAPQMNEHTTWMQKDEHAQAYVHLKSPLGRQMARRLGLPEPAHESPACLSCHATAKEFYDHGERFDVRDGVSCEICHGGSTGWLGPHVAPGWKQKPPAEKEALGLRDLSTPEKRLAMCVDCHVGGPGRVVDHDIIAAGHPPLFFEAAAFVAEMPPHWTDDQDWTLQTWFAGQVTNLVGQLGRIERSAQDRSRWPDYAVYDCFSCHHDLDKEGLYARIDPPGRVGRPPVDPAFANVLGEALAVLDPGAAGTLKQLYSSVTTAADGGDPAGVASATAGGADRARAMLSAGSNLNGQTASQILGRLDERLRAIAEDRIRTPRHDALQIAWAIRALAADRDSEAFAGAWGALEKALDEEGKYDPALFAQRARAALAAGR